MTYCFDAMPYDRMQFLIYLNLWHATIKFEYMNRSDAGGPFFRSWHNREFYAKTRKERLRLYFRVLEWSRD